MRLLLSTVGLVSLVDLAGCSGEAASLGSGMRSEAGTSPLADGHVRDVEAGVACETSVTCASALVCTSGTCAPPTGVGDMTPPCSPPSGSCNGASPIMNRYDVARGCLDAVVTLRGVCNTSVNRCAPSDGIGVSCAFSPDGGVFVGEATDNDILTAKGWQFSECTQCFPDPSVVPADEVTTDAENVICAKAMCAPACPGVTAGVPSFGQCPDAGH